MEHPTVEESGSVSGRRRFLSWFCVAWSAFAAASALGVAAVARFFFPRVRFEPPMVLCAGLPEEFAIGKVDERLKGNGVWIVRSEEGFYALTTICTHLGCTPIWLEGENKFKCPCHGSGFRRSGVNFEGPAPRALGRFRIGLTAEGEIVIDKSREFLFEKGEWEDPDAFLPYG